MTRVPDKLMLIRRRRTMRVVGTLLFLVLVAVLMNLSGGKGGSGGGQKPAAAKLPCPEVDAPEATPQTFDAPPELSLEQGVDYTALVTTSCGDIEIDLLEADTPRTVANFVFLVENGFYNGLPWHRIEGDFVIQTGDPDGVPATDREGPGYTIPDELPAENTKYFYGDVAMATNGPGTGGSQFFVVVHDQETKKDDAGLQSDYAIFGRVLESSYETLDKIARMPVKGGDDIYAAVSPTSPVVIESIEIRT